MNKRLLFSLLLGMAHAVTSSVGSSHPADENPDLTLPETTREFRQDRLGMFINWGVYSVLCDGESPISARQLPLSDYEKLAQFFNPAKFNTAEWVALAKAAGAHYITFTAKSRDGFAMWDTKASDWKVTGRTPFARDVVKELAEECQREGIKLYLYYSPLDWHHSETFGPGGDSISTSRLADSMTTTSVSYTDAQLTELLSNYGKIHGVWLDGWWDTPDAAPQLQNVYRTIRKLQPAALIGNNHGQSPQPNEDFQISSRDLLSPAAPATTTGLEYSPVPLEIPATINQSSAFRITDQQFKSTRDLVHMLVRAAGMDANLLLNVGPMPDGQIQPEHNERLRRLGMWLAKNGESIYATRGGPMPPQPWGVTTHRRNKVYVHVLDPEVTEVEVQLPAMVRNARHLADESDVTIERSGDIVILNLRPERRGEMERILVLETRMFEE